jgi:hypothetical protein
MSTRKRLVDISREAFGMVFMIRSVRARNMHCIDDRYMTFLFRRTTS